jgi:hypothetical protein
MEAKHDDAISVLLWLRSGMEKLLISASWDGKIAIWKQSHIEPVQKEVKVSNSVSDHWGEVKLSKSVSDHWGGVERSNSPSPVATTTAISSEDKTGLVESFGRGLKMLSRSPSRNSLHQLPNAPLESPGSGGLARKGSFKQRSSFSEGRKSAKEANVKQDSLRK